MLTGDSSILRRTGRRHWLRSSPGKIDAAAHLYHVQNGDKEAVIDSERRERGTLCRGMSPGSIEDEIFIRCHSSERIISENAR
jgi:hypothetical protein